MGVSIPKGLTISGFRASVFKGALRAFERTHSRASFIALKSVVGDYRDGAIVFEECLDHRLIGSSDDDRFTLTEAGEAIAASKIASRTSLDRALLLVERLLENATSLNADPSAVRLVDQVWIFGSVMRREDTVGDIDMAITTSRRPPLDKDYKALRAEVARQLNTLTDAPRTFWAELNGEHWLTQRRLFGSKRHPLLAGVQFELSDLLQLAAPCQLIFDRARGGKIQDAPLDRHPESPGRSNTLATPHTLPEFSSPDALRPMDGRWVTGFSGYGEVSPYKIFGSWNDAAHALYPQYPRDLRVWAEKSHWSSDGWKPKRLAQPGVDGREQLLIAKTDGWAAFSVVLRRRIITTDDCLEIQAWLETPEFHRVRTQLWGLAEEINSTVALILAADAERALRRQLDQGVKQQTKLVLHHRDVAKPLVTQVLEPTTALLHARKVRIEPEGWRGPAVSVTLS